MTFACKIYPLFLLDLSYLRNIPNIKIIAPKDENELGHMLRTALDLNSPVAIRYPRGSGVGIGIENPLETIEVKSEILKPGKDVLILAVGPIVYEALEAAEDLEKKKISVCVVNARFIKPLDEKTIITLAKKIKKIITIEENTIEGGFGSAVLELLGRNNIKCNVKRIGIPDKFIEHGPIEILKQQIGLTKKNIIKTAMSMKFTNLCSKHGKHFNKRCR